MNLRGTFIGALAAFALAVVNGCSTSRPHASANSACGKETDLPATAGISAPLTDRSLYQLDSIWTNDAAKPLRLVELRGRPQIVVMFFTSCAYACPLLVQDLKRIEAALPERVRAQAGFVLVSFDSERDTPPALAVYRERQHLPRNRWTLLRGQPDDVLELAALLGVKYKQDARGQFSHSNLITVLNAEGEVVQQQVGLNQGIDETVSAVQRLAAP